MFLMKYKFFDPGETTGDTGAGDESANIGEPAEPQTESDEGSEETEEPEEDEEQSEAEGEEGVNNAESAVQQSPEANAAFAAMRRRAEAAEQKLAQLDRFAEHYKGFENPVTHQKINSAGDYFAALAAQEQMQTEEKLRNAGLDPSIIEQAVQNNPVVRQAKAAMQRENQQRAQEMLNEDFDNIIAMDPTVNSVEDVQKADGFQDAVAYTQNHPGIRLSDAYKIVNFDRLASEKAGAARQKAINDVKGKQHLGTAAGVSGKDNTVDIPQSELERWKEMFPEASAKELKKKYNRMLRTQS